jgi:hypothetical protein
MNEKLKSRNLAALDSWNAVHRRNDNSGNTGNAVHRQNDDLGDTGNAVHRNRCHNWDHSDIFYHFEMVESISVMTHMMKDMGTNWNIVMMKRNMDNNWRNYEKSYVNQILHDLFYENDGATENDPWTCLLNFFHDVHVLDQGHLQTFQTFPRKQHHPLNL